MNEALPTSPPVILFPAHGCQPVGALDQKAAAKQMKQMRETVREHWHDDGVMAIVQLIEQRGARLQRQAIAPGATAHEAGQAFALDELITILHGIVLSQEESPGG